MCPNIKKCALIPKKIRTLLRNGQVNTFGGTIYFAVDDTTQETSMEQTKPDSENPDAQSVPKSSQWNCTIRS